MFVYHVTLCCVDVVSQTLQSDPLDRQLGHGALSVVIATVDLLGESKVCDAHHHVLMQPETHKHTPLRVCAS